MKKSIFPILGIFVAVVGIGVPILWDMLRYKQALELQIVSSISLLEKDPIMDKLEIRYKDKYKDKQIKDLTKFIFVLINTGRRPIVEEHVQRFPTLVFGEGNEILFAEVLRSDPNDLEARIQIDADTLIVKFPLLNPTDFVEFNSYVSGYPGITPEITSRIQGIKNLNVVNKTVEVPKSDRKKGWVIYPVAIFTTLGILILLAGYNEIRQHLDIHRVVVRENPHILDDLKEKQDFEKFIDNYLGFVPNREKRSLEGLLEAWDNSAEDIADVRNHLKLLIQKRIFEISGPLAIFVLVLVFTLVGVSYILVKFVF
jgi:hypothetical protein